MYALTGKDKNIFLKRKKQNQQNRNQKQIYLADYMMTGYVMTAPGRGLIHLFLEESLMPGLKGYEMGRGDIAHHLISALRFPANVFSPQVVDWASGGSAAAKSWKYEREAWGGDLIAMERERKSGTLFYLVVWARVRNQNTPICQEAL